MLPHILSPPCADVAFRRYAAMMLLLPLRLILHYLPLLRRYAAIDAAIDATPLLFSTYASAYAAVDMPLITPFRVLMLTYIVVPLRHAMAITPLLFVDTYAA